MVDINKRQGDLTTAQKANINANLRKIGIPTEVDELTSELSNLIPESRNPRKFDDDIKK